MRNSCYNCKWFGMGLASCMNNLSKRWGDWVTIDDVCDDWEEDEENGDD